jgi:hypothetical protein
MSDQPFLISPRNSAEGICHLLRSVSTHHLISTATSLAPILEKVQWLLNQEQYMLEIEELPAFTEAYPLLGQETIADAFEPQPGIPNRDAYTDGVVAYLHSSGSTGFPKSIPYRWNFICSLMRIGIYLHSGPCNFWS